MLTDAMTRLHGEILSARHARVALRGGLVQRTVERRTRVSALCAGFARDRAGGRRAWFGPALSERQSAEIQPRRGLMAQAGADAPAGPGTHEPAGHVLEAAA